MKEEITGRLKCIQNDSYDEAGTLISGHRYIDKVTIHDLEIDRYYGVMECMNCGAMSASFTDSRDLALSHPTKIIVVGER